VEVYIMKCHKERDVLCISSIVRSYKYTVYIIYISNMML